MKARASPVPQRGFAAATRHSRHMTAVSPVARGRGNTSAGPKKVAEGYSTEDSDEEADRELGRGRGRAPFDDSHGDGARDGNGIVCATRASLRLRSARSRNRSTPALTGRTSRQQVEESPKQRKNAANFASTVAQRNQLLFNAQDLMGSKAGGGGSGGRNRRQSNEGRERSVSPHRPHRNQNQQSGGHKNRGGLQLGGQHHFSSTDGRSTVLDLNRRSVTEGGSHLDLSHMDLGSGSTNISPHQQQHFSPWSSRAQPDAGLQHGSTPGTQLDAAAWTMFGALQSQNRHAADTGIVWPSDGMFSQTSPSMRPPPRSWNGLPTSPSSPTYVTRRAPRSSSSLSSLHLANHKPSAWELLSRDPVNPQGPAVLPRRLLLPFQEHGEEGLHLETDPSFSRFSGSGTLWRQQQQSSVDAAVAATAAAAAAAAAPTPASALPLLPLHARRASASGAAQQLNPRSPHLQLGGSFRSATANAAAAGGAVVNGSGGTGRVMSAMSLLDLSTSHGNGEAPRQPRAVECGHSSGDSEGAVLTLDFTSRGSSAATASAALASLPNPSPELPNGSTAAVAASGPAKEGSGSDNVMAEATQQLQAAGGDGVIEVEEAGPGDVPDPVALNKIRSHVLEIEGRYGRAHPETGKAWLMLARVLEHHCTRWSLCQGERALLSAWEVVSAVQAQADPQALPQSFPQFIFLLEQVRAESFSGVTAELRHVRSQQ